jgi:C1A family cysteine protease
VEQKRIAFENIKIAQSFVDFNNELFLRSEVSYKLELQWFSHLSEFEFTRKFLGLLPPTEKIRRKRAALTAAECKDVPDSLDWTKLNKVAHVKDQKECGSCYIFSSTGAIESAIAIEYGITPINMSIQHSLDCIKDPKTGKQNGCTGGRPEWVWKAASDENGQVRETKDNEYTGIAGKECNEKASKLEITDVDYWEQVNFGGLPEEVEEQIKCRLAKSGPFHVSMAVKKNEMGSFKSGVYKASEGICSSGEKVNHGLLLVGYGEKLLEGDREKTKYWIIQNSWGERWGDDGYLYVERGVNICGFASDAHFPLLKKKLSPIAKPAVCKEARDLFDGSNNYLKSLCLVEDEKPYDEAQNICLNNGMRLFRAESSSDKEALFAYANKQWSSRTGFTPIINGITITETPACTTINKSGESFEEVSDNDCYDLFPFVGEFVNKDPQQ